MSVRIFLEREHSTDSLKQKQVGGWGGLCSAKNRLEPSQKSLGLFFLVGIWIFVHFFSLFFFFFSLEVVDFSLTIPTVMIDKKFNITYWNCISLV